ncbi:MAG: hypothetical protein WC022_03265 [Parcubacteria group bacterium]
MANKKSTETGIRKLTKVGRASIAVTLPIELVRELGWKERQRVTVKKSGQNLIISDWKK